jgi:LPXTG-site transpeptidase (sortase) family protein
MTPYVPFLRRRALLAGLMGMGAITLGDPLLRPPRAQAADDSEDAGSTAAPDSSDQVASYGPPVWMRIPRIHVDSATVDVGVTDGYYDVPWFDIGHHADSANPGQPGNSIFNGHVLTIDAGRVFYRLNELAPGDAVFVYTAAYRSGWEVVAVFAVPDGDNRFLEPTSDPQLTLYTCTGAFNPIERMFAERLVVVGELQELVPRG